jgi:hypothetical protein
MPDRNPHGVRSLFVQGNVVASALLVVLFYLVACSSSAVPCPHCSRSIMLGFGTMVWPFSGRVSASLWPPCSPSRFFLSAAHQ